VPLCLTTVVGAFHISLMGVNRREVVTQFCGEISQEETIFEGQGNCKILLKWFFVNFLRDSKVHTACRSFTVA
jgi:uncharacterized membrane protein YuzA (DUF378 family)